MSERTLTLTVLLIRAYRAQALSTIKGCFMNIDRRLALVALAALLIPMALAYAPVYADGTPSRVRGSVVSLDGSKLVVRAKDGKDISVSLADNFAALAVVKSSIADIKQGTFIGTATVTQPDSTLRSVEVVVFPDNLRGTAEGHYPWDLGPSSMMTNATVANAVKGVDGQTVTVTYKGGEKKIDIPECARCGGCSGEQGRPQTRRCCVLPSVRSIGWSLDQRCGPVRQGHRDPADVALRPGTTLVSAAQRLQPRRHREHVRD
jgi:hypothetical protein